MSLYTKASEWIRTKLNPAQQEIARDSGSEVNSDAVLAFARSFDNIESVNRGISMIVHACASLDYDVKDSLPASIVPGMRKKSLENLLNFRPNPYQSSQEFRQDIFMDLVLEGNVFIYFDGAFMYHLPAAHVTIETDERTRVRGYLYNSTTRFTSDEVFHFRDLSSTSTFRGTSRLQAARTSITNTNSMLSFQQNFFDNGAVFGLVFTTDNTLSSMAKEKTLSYWSQRYNPKTGGKRPVILDSGLKPYPIAQTNFKDMDFDASLKTHGEKILQVLGVPPILLAGGNNANISPNLRLFYLETVLPLVRKFTSALERYFGYDIEAITTTVSALQPELKDVASYHATLVNGGIISPNEARKELRFEAKTGHDELRVPANIAGSASDPSSGGKPKQPTKEPT